jgi:alpha-tubulin suppressor-like RCC1 family protein
MPAPSARRDVYCWESNLHGERGFGDGGAVGTATKVQGIANAASIDAGQSLTCALTTSGTTYCWGLLGTAATAAPTSISAPSFTSIAVGGAHACGLTSDGTAYCWGAPGSDQVGTGGRGDGRTAAPVITTAKFTQLTAGAAHTCGVTSSGTAYCWGTGGFGRLGTGSEAAMSVPTPVNTSVAFASISAGDFHTCALTADGAAYCWGRNPFGELGDSTAYNPNGTAAELTRASPVHVTSSIVFRSISASGVGHHTCAVSVAGLVVCWGRNNSGELGMGRRQLLAGTTLYVSTTAQSVVDPIR